MYFLTATESQHWQELRAEILATDPDPQEFTYPGRRMLSPIFKFYVGTSLALAGHQGTGSRWLKASALEEDDQLMLSTIALAFLQRHGGQFVMPATVFADPTPYIHFTTMPTMVGARARFVAFCTQTLPVYTRPVRFMDIGPGDGSLTGDVLAGLLRAGVIPALEEIVLVERSADMLACARKLLGKRLPGVRITGLQGAIEEVVDAVPPGCDIAISSLAYHHMPIETKIATTEQLREKIDNFVLFELEADNDTPEQGSPELLCSMYQTYARLIGYVFEHDASLETAIRCVDCFLMTEAVSFLTQPRGQRNDYHMKREQWHSMFQRGLGADFRCAAESTCFADGFMDLYCMHYGRR